jgi:hypothetical protein
VLRLFFGGASSGTIQTITNFPYAPGEYRLRFLGQCVALPFEVVRPPVNGAIVVPSTEVGVALGKRWFAIDYRFSLLLDFNPGVASVILQQPGGACNHTTVTLEWRAP